MGLMNPTKKDATAGSPRGSTSLVRTPYSFSFERMDFMKIIKSLEALLYELMVWLVFYPKTVWLSAFQPQKMMQYSDNEIEDESEDDQYSDTLSPPIFLALSLIIAHYLETSIVGELGFAGVLADETNLLAYRVVSFSLFPLVFALRLLRKKGIALDRKALKQPFYAQCYVAAIFGLAINLASFLDDLPWQHGRLGMIAGLVVVVCWYLLVQSRWFARELQVSLTSGAGTAVVGFGQGVLIVWLLTIVVSSV